MTYDIDKVIRYGQSIGASKALIINGKLRHYYKKGDKTNRFSPYMYDEDFVWKDTNMSSIGYILRCAKNSYPNVEIIDIN